MAVVNNEGKGKWGWDGMDYARIYGEVDSFWLKDGTATHAPRISNSPAPPTTFRRRRHHDLHLHLLPLPRMATELFDRPDTSPALGLLVLLLLALVL